MGKAVHFPMYHVIARLGEAISVFTFHFLFIQGVPADNQAVGLSVSSLHPPEADLRAFHCNPSREKTAFKKNVKIYA
jgi:hypothetical protein